MTQAQQTNDLERVRRLTNKGFGIMQMAAVIPEVFLHHNFGERYIVKRTGLAVILMLVFIPFFPDPKPWPFMCFLGAFIVLALMAQLGAVIRRWRGRETHTYYTGRPHLMLLFPRANERAIKVLEPFLVFGAGYLVYRVDHLIGALLMATAFALIMCVLVCIQHERAQEMDMNDAILDQQRNADRIRKNKKF